LPSSSKRCSCTESDTFGPIEVDASRYWGAQAQRSLGNFKIGWEKQPAPVVRALGIVKRAAAETNMDLGKMDPKLGQATIVAAARRSSKASSTITSRWSSGRPGRAPSPT
jgi:fumarate hydratase class II